ncbi:copper amine oxidase [Xylariomycetidae sp. FL2044]|nr:copper amine oxidase [Xylariomycetidae sp. FL2044]
MTILTSAAVLLLAYTSLASALPPLGLKRQRLLPKFASRAVSYANTTCSESPLYEEATAVKAAKENIWAPISPEDNVAVWNLLHDPTTGLNLTDADSAGINDNYLWFIDTIHVNKSDALPYLDGQGPKPSSWARAVIFEGGKSEPVSQEYIIGPMPVSSETTVQKLDYPYNGGKGGTVPYNGRNFDSKRSAATMPVLMSVMSNLTDITEALLGGVWYGQSDERSTLTATSTAPSSFDGTQANAIWMFRYPGTASYLRPVDFFVLMDCTGTDMSLYSLKGIVTNTRFFPTIAELRAAFDAGQLKEDYYQAATDDWAMLTLDTDMGARDLDDKFAPQSLELGGKRYKVDAEQKYVEYLGWSFYISNTITLGIMFYDIRFKGERILYELSLQEAAAQYGGFQPKSANTLYHDTYYWLGAEIFPLVEGFDCPYGSTFWDISVHSGNKTSVRPGAICIFESDPGFPLSRHRAAGGTSDYGFQNLGVVKGSMLTVRAIATVGNYDYLFDYAFHADGSLEITVRASGYLQSSFYYKDQGKWGPRIHEGTQGSLHDHVLTFKADFDILDTSNSLQVTELRAAPTSQPWFPELGVFEQLELHAYNLPTERQFDWDANGQSMYCVNHATATNRWGEARGYRIVPGKSDIHLSTLRSPFSRGNSAFAKSHLAVTRQHDTEPWANSVQNLNLPWAPQQDFLRFFDDAEPVEAEDLVVWFNLGMHHFTRAEDVPVTLYSEAVSSVMFAPQNFFDRAQDGDLRNRVWMLPVEGDDASVSVEDYGVVRPEGFEVGVGAMYEV